MTEFLIGIGTGIALTCSAYALGRLSVYVNRPRAGQRQSPAREPK